MSSTKSVYLFCAKRENSAERMKIPQNILNFSLNNVVAGLLYSFLHNNNNLQYSYSYVYTVTYVEQEERLQRKKRRGRQRQER